MYMLSIQIHPHYSHDLRAHARRPLRLSHTHPNARNTRRAHHPGSTGDSGEIEGAHEGAICTNSEGQLCRPGCKRQSANNHTRV